MLAEVVVHVVSMYATQMGCAKAEKYGFWKLLGNVTRKIFVSEVVWIVGHLNGHIGKGREATEQIGRYGLGDRSEGEDRILDCANLKNMAMLNTYFQKQSSRVATYCNGGKNTQVDYIMSRKRTANSKKLPYLKRK